MELIAGDDPGTCRLVARTPPHALLANLGLASMRSALGNGHDRFDWRACTGPLKISNLAADTWSDGPVLSQRMDDGDVMLCSGGDGEWRGYPDLQIHPRLLMPRSFTLLLAQQWARSGALPLHAAMLVVDGRGVLVLGRRGAGKSVLGLAAVSAGHQLVSDDTVLLAPSSEGVIVAERLRSFFMLRHGWAAGRLLQRLPGLAFASGERPKTSCMVPDDDQRRFPHMAGIDAIWLLQRPHDARPDCSRIGPVAPQFVLAALIEAGSAMLFGSSFPYERRAVQRTLDHLLATCPCLTLCTGTDIVERPETALPRLLQASLGPSRPGRH